MLRAMVQSRCKALMLGMFLSIVLFPCGSKWIVEGGVSSASEHDISANLTLQISKFVTWPKRSARGSDRPFFIIGVMGDRNTQSAFKKLNGIRLKGLTVRIVRILPSTDHREIRRCHIVYSDGAHNVDVVKDMIGGAKGVLSVCGTRAKAIGNTCVMFVRKGRGLGFDVDLKCTRSAGLSLDAGLLRLARNVKK